MEFFRTVAQLSCALPRLLCGSVAPFDKQFFLPFQMGWICNETRSPALRSRVTRAARRARHHLTKTPGSVLGDKVSTLSSLRFAGKIWEPITRASITPYASFAGNATAHRGPSPGMVLRTWGVGFRRSVRSSSRPTPDMTGCGASANADSRHAACSSRNFRSFQMNTSIISYIPAITS